MVKCLNCGEEVDEGSIFCQNCGSKMEQMPKENHVPVNVVNASCSSFEEKKFLMMIILGYLALIVQFVSLLFASFNVKVINADRLILYPLLCVMLSFYISFKLVQNERTYIHSIIIAIISVILFVISII